MCSVVSGFQPLSTICVVEHGGHAVSGQERRGLLPKRSFMTLDPDSHGCTVNTIALATILDCTCSDLGKRFQDYGGCLCQVHSDEASPPHSRHTVSYMEYHPFHVLSLASHARIHPPYPPQIPLNRRGESLFLCCQPSFGVKAASHLPTSHLMSHISKQSTPLVPRYLGDPLY
jgi:hypothetical protein